ncbi:hypothetical protein N7478_003667 [Penicillium angulare]|uniref:uncharacterized protein n=1 Tax=Penicillium angulare TaxID=116970 RepID=UPI00253FA382|nr:uncharacterized protein N7478_003667 [Penicillium angulare]KAJ5287981.1 hypothetical protein N7478_003667 [Penicillium angulare]
MDEPVSNQTVVYLTDPYKGTLITDDCYAAISLEVLPPKGPMNSDNCIMLSCNDHPYLRRQYIPSQAYLRQNPQVKVDFVWIGVPMEYGIYRKFSERDWFLSLKHAIEQGEYSITRNPKRAGGSRTFWMQMRGYFGYSEYNLISAAAERHVELIKQLVQHGIVTLKKEGILSVLGHRI